MAEHLLPPHDLTLPAKPRSSADGADDDEEASGKKGTYEQLFKEQVVLIDEAGAPFRVQYEGVACNAQKHLRLTCGWRDYIRQHKVEVGECQCWGQLGLDQLFASNCLLQHCVVVAVVSGPGQLWATVPKRMVHCKCL